MTMIIVMKMIITLLLIIIMTMNIVMKMIITLMMIIIIALIIHYDKDHNHYADHNHDIVDVLNSDADDDDDVLYNVSLRVQAAILLRSVQDHGVTPLLAHLLPLPVQCTVYSHTTRIHIEEKAKVVAALGEKEVIQFLATQAILHLADLKKNMNIIPANSRIQSRNQIILAPQNCIFAYQFFPRLIENSTFLI